LSRSTSSYSRKPGRG